jgi:hypothetical protein
MWIWQPMMSNLRLQVPYFSNIHLAKRENGKTHALSIFFAAFHPGKVSGPPGFRSIKPLLVVGLSLFEMASRTYTLRMARLFRSLA